MAAVLLAWVSFSAVGMTGYIGFEELDGRAENVQAFDAPWPKWPEPSNLDPALPFMGVSVGWAPKNPTTLNVTPVWVGATFPVGLDAVNVADRMNGTFHEAGVGFTQTYWAYPGPPEERFAHGVSVNEGISFDEALERVRAHLAQYPGPESFRVGETGWAWAKDFEDAAQLYRGHARYSLWSPFYAANISYADGAGVETVFVLFTAEVLGGDTPNGTVFYGGLAGQPAISVRVGEGAPVDAILVHEMGHRLGLDHGDGGIMSVPGSVVLSDLERSKLKARWGNPPDGSP